MYPPEMLSRVTLEEAVPPERASMGPPKRKSPGMGSTNEILEEEILYFHFLPNVIER